MAAPRNRQQDVPSVEETDTDIPDIPAEFDDASSNGMSASLDTLNRVTFDDDRDELEYKKMTPPPGDWEKVERWQVKEYIYTNDTAPGDRNPNGRLVWAITGYPKVRIVNGLDYCPLLMIRISPDLRFKEGSTTDRDSAYKLFLQCKNLFISLKGRSPKGSEELLPVLAEDAYTVRTMQGDNGPVVVQVKANRRGR